MDRAVESAIVQPYALKSTHRWLLSRQSRQQPSKPFAEELLTGLSAAAADNDVNEVEKDNCKLKCQMTWLTVRHLYHDTYKGQWCTEKREIR